ncbi:MAG: hypothetical protein LBU84_08400 [Prevotella sp.]|jgi:peptidoglycan hydrolase CwlO-like protein|nr:hypothetical protein [Prevotella sp.]
MPWICESCETENNDIDENCIVCNEIKPSSDEKGKIYIPRGRPSIGRYSVISSHSSAKSALDLLQNEHTKLLAEHDELKVLNSKCNTLIKKLLVERDKLKSECDMVNTERDRIKNNCVKMETEIKELKKKISTLQPLTKIDTHKYHIKKWVFNIGLIAVLLSFIICFMYLYIGYTKLDIISTDLNNTQVTLSKTLSDLSTAQGTLSKTQTELSNTQTTLKNTQPQLRNVQSVLNNTQTELNILQSTLSGTQTELSTYKSLYNRFIAKYPAFSITDLQVYNPEDTTRGAIYSSTTTSLYAELKYESFLQNSQTYTLYIKMYYPNGNLIELKDSPTDYTDTNRVSIGISSGTAIIFKVRQNAAGKWKRGTYVIEIWYNNMCLKESKFIIQ